jgi:biopolymer transport protein ExbD
VQTISINKEAVLKLNGTLTELAQIEADLTALKAANSEVAVVIRSHKELPVQQLIDVMDAVQRAKIGRLGVVTSPDTQ